MVALMLFKVVFCFVDMFGSTFHTAEV